MSFFRTIRHLNYVVSLKRKIAMGRVLDCRLKMDKVAVVWKNNETATGLASGCSLQTDKVVAALITKKIVMELALESK